MAVSLDGMYKDTTKVSILRLHRDMPCSRVLVAEINSLLNEDARLSATTQSFLLYPVIKWILSQMPATRKIDRYVISDEVSEEMAELRSILSGFGASEAKLYMQNRDIFFRNCCSLAYQVDKAFGAMPEKTAGEKAAKGLVEQVFGLSDSKGSDNNIPSRYMIRKTLQDAMRKIAEQYGDDFAATVQSLLPKTRITGEEAHLSHNVNALVREYRKLLWNGHAENITAKMLKCKTKEELQRMAVTSKVYASTYVLCEYIQLIRAAAIGVDTFASTEKYGEIIEMMLGPQQLDDKEMAMRLLLSDRTFARRKKTACELFGTLLWGCDARALLGLFGEAE